MKPIFYVLLWLTLSLLVLDALVESTFGATESEVATLIDVTESTMVECYLAVAEADKSGANVTLLLDLLFDAGQFLSLAEVAFQAGDFDSAFFNVSQSQVLLSGIVEEAEVLEDNAFSKNYWSLITDVLVSITGTVVIIVGSVVVLGLLKRRFVGGSS